jgi:hypothetical protein
VGAGSLSPNDIPKEISVFHSFYFMGYLLVNDLHSKDQLSNNVHAIGNRTTVPLIRPFSGIHEVTERLD